VEDGVSVLCPEAIAGLECPKDSDVGWDVQNHASLNDVELFEGLPLKLKID
jgi:hypothetical protein